jgi:DNA-directed RNA polymerase subunit E'/Rpb7
MKLISPYRKIKQHTRISIDSYHMNSDIKNNIKIILKKKVEKKCNKNGFVDEVYRVLEYSDGLLPSENLNGAAIYNITYHCKICIPVENTVIIGLVRVTNQEIVIAINGPIMIFISRENIDTNVWDISEGYLNKNINRKLISGDYVKIQIIDKRINQYDSLIKTTGKLLDFAKSEEVEKYYGSTIVSESKNEETVFDSKTEIVNTEEETESNFII